MDEMNQISWRIRVGRIDAMYYRGGHNFFEHPHPGANEKKFGLTFFRFFYFL